MELYTSGFFSSSACLVTTLVSVLSWLGSFFLPLNSFRTVQRWDIIIVRLLRELRKILYFILLTKHACFYIYREKCFRVWILLADVFKSADLNFSIGVSENADVNFTTGCWNSTVG